VPPEQWTKGSAVFNAVADTYDARRPGFPPEVFEEVAATTGLGRGSPVVEIGPGTGQATIRLAELGAQLVAVEPGPALVELLSRRLAAFPDVTIVSSRFEDWQPPKLGFDAVVAASSWHWLDPVTRWQKAHDVLNPSGWLVLLGHVVVRDPDEPEVYAETADLHEAYASGHPSWGHPPTADDVIDAAESASGTIADVERVIGRAPDSFATDDLFQPPLISWHRQVQHFDAHGYVEQLRTTSLYGSLKDEVRGPLLSAIEQRIRERMGDHATRSYLISTRLAERKR
jgi:SAM-dependent methyltransferase